MTPLPVRRPVPAARRSTAAVLLAATGLGLVAAGAALPWVSIYAGLAPIPGFLLDGGPLAGLALASGGLLLATHRLGGGRALRPLAALFGLAIALDAAITASRIAAYVADPGPAAALTQPAGGPGAVLMSAGGILLAAAAIALRPARRSLTRADATRLLLAATLLVAGWIHLVLTPEHLGESTALGIGFLAAGLAQTLLATLILVRASGAAMVAVVAVNAALLGLYAWAVAVGLPFGHGGEELHAAAAGITVLWGEPIDLAGAANALAQVLGLALAFALLGAEQHPGADGGAMDETPSRLHRVRIPMSPRRAPSPRLQAPEPWDPATTHR